MDTSAALDIEGASRPLALHRLAPQDWRDASSYVFLGFVMYHHRSVCKCGALDSHSEVMRVFGHRTLLATHGRRMTPFIADTLPRDEPVAVYDMPDKHTPVCHRCITNIQRPGEEVIHLRMASDERNWFAALMNDQRRMWRDAVTGAKKPEPKITVSDDILLNM